MRTETAGKGWAIVTGASSGMGLVFARKLALRGHNVLAVARRQPRLEMLARGAATEGGRIDTLVADLATREGLESVVTRISELATIDLLVNNAGVATSGDFSDSALEEELAETDLNVNAVVTLTHTVLRRMLLQKSGAIINLASVVAFHRCRISPFTRRPKPSSYPSTEALAEEVQGSGVRIMALCPGAAKSEMTVFSNNAGLLGKLPSLSAEQIVTAALQGLDAGKVVKIVAWPNRMLVLLNRFVPRAAVRQMMGAIAKPPPRPAADRTTRAVRR